MIPTGTARPIRPELVSIVSLSHDYSNGQRWQVVTIYEDDHDANARRVLDLRLPMTPKDNVKRAAELEAKISYCDGYNREKHRWGDAATPKGAWAHCMAHQRQRLEQHTGGAQ